MQAAISRDHEEAVTKIDLIVAKNMSSFPIYTKNK